MADTKRRRFWHAHADGFTGVLFASAHGPELPDVWNDDCIGLVVAWRIIASMVGSACHGLFVASCNTGSHLEQPEPGQRSIGRLLQLGSALGIVGLGHVYHGPDDLGHSRLSMANVGESIIWQWLPERAE